MLNRIFPHGIDSLHLINRMSQIKRLILSIFIKDIKNINRHKILIIVNTERFNCSQDDNISGLIEELNRSSFRFNIFALPPSLRDHIKIGDNIFYIDRFNHYFIKILLLWILPFTKVNLKSYWDLILDYYKPKIIISYQPTEELCESCEKKHVNLLELQHGNVWNYMNNDRRYRPSIFLAWDKESSLKAKYFNFSKKYYVLGYPEIFLSQNREIIHKNNKKKILITLTDNMSLFYSKFPYMSLKNIGSLCIPHLSNLLNNPELKDIEWIIRMHPISTPKDIKLITKNINFLKNQNTKLNILIDNNRSLISQIRESSLHISLNSSAAMKCSLLNIKSIMTCPVYNKSKYFNDLRKNKSCFILEENYTAEELTSLVISLLTNYDQNIDSNIYEFSKYRLNQLLKEIL